MNDCVERKFGKLTVRIDRTLCVGFGDCVEGAGDVFALDDEEVAVFRKAPEGVNRQKLLEACASCPVDALEVRDEDGTQLVP